MYSSFSVVQNSKKLALCGASSEQRAVLQIKDQKDEKDKTYFLLYSAQLFSVVVCSPGFLDFIGYRAGVCECALKFT